jgi:D-alanyl-D-alanine carboxypeptidase
MKRKSKVILLIVVVIVLAGAVYVLFNGLPWEGGKPDPRDSDGSEISAADADADSRDTSVEGGIGEGSEKMNTAESLWYYDESHTERYAAFAALRPELSEDNIVWMVEADLDKPAYVDTSEASEPDSLTALINKHFYLPDDYTPSDLVTIGGTMLRSEAAGAVQDMIEAAEKEGHNLWSQSGFRSYGVQVSLYDQYSASDGTDAADTYSARPGYSEHQSGLTTDLNTITDAFGETPEGIWASENCWKFGFIVRYTEENTDITLYKPEPWHLRYIGREAAEDMHNTGIISFEEYWVKYIKNTPA